MSKSSRQSKATKVNQEQSSPTEVDQVQSSTPQIVPVLKPITNTTTFENDQQFNEYYTSHKDEMDKLNTTKLNKMFLVPEYKITRVKGVLSLKLLTPSKVNHTVKLNDQETRISEITCRLERLDRKINSIMLFLDAEFDSLVDEFFTDELKDYSENPNTEPLYPTPRQLSSGHSTRSTARV